MTTRRRHDRSVPQQRGVALVLVLTTIAILTSIGVDFSYSSRVSLKLAENLRDETRAYYLARSAVNLSRLLLHFQKQLDGLGGQLSSALTQLSRPPGTPAPAGAAPATAAAPATSLGIRLWELLPIDSNAFSALLGGAPMGPASSDKLPPPPGDRPALHSFGGFDGSFNARIVDENSRINVTRLDGLQGASANTLIQLRAMMADPKYDFIFNEPDAQGDRVARDDVIIALKDWIDQDETGSAIDPSNPLSPFANGFSDENSAYARYEPRYKAKNSRFDSLQELFMARGVNDRFMAAFGDRLTIWVDVNAGLNVNTNDPLQMLTNILIASANPNDPSLRDPRLLQTILQEIQLRKMFSFFGMSARDFVAVLSANGIRLRPQIDPKQGGNPDTFFSSASDTFRITATGRVGHVEKTLTAVVRYDDALGKLMYWKED